MPKERPSILKSKTEKKAKARSSPRVSAAARSGATTKAVKATRKRGTLPSTPMLLSGGNPQIPKGDGDAPVQAYITAIPGWQQEVAQRLDAIIERAVPGVSKAVRWNSPFYGVEGNGWFLSFHVFTRYVKVTFFAGSLLKPLPAGTSKSPEVRYADLHEGELDERQMTAWVKQAAKLPGWSP